MSDPVERVPGSTAITSPSITASRRVVEVRMAGTPRWAVVEDVGRLHQLMHDNAHPPGNMAVLVNAQRSGLRTYEDVLELSGAR